MAAGFSSLEPAGGDLMAVRQTAALFHVPSQEYARIAGQLQRV